MHLLPDRASHSYLLQKDNLAALVITDALSAGSRSLFEVMNKTSECATSLLYIHLSSSAVTMKESERFALKEQLSVLLAILFPSDFPRNRAIETLYTDLGIVSVFRNFDGRHRTAILLQLHLILQLILIPYCKRKPEMKENTIASTGTPSF